MIKAEIIADSKNEFDDRITTFIVTFPRIVLAELNTHRMFSRNSASSRAIPFKKMVKMVQENPFIPIAWQKDHKGMQGTDYHNSNQLFSLEDFSGELRKLLGDKYHQPVLHFLRDLEELRMTLGDWWLYSRDRALECACIMSIFGLTKQLCNRLLEPFMWHTAIITATEFENFFALRCPQYVGAKPNITYRSIKDFSEGENLKESFSWTTVQRLEINKSGAEIHIQALAEAMWDAYNESEPKKLKAGEWHIPYGDQFNADQLLKLCKPDSNSNILFTKEVKDDLKIKIATARCARLSYKTFGDNPKVDYEADIKLHDRLMLSSPPHASPGEHCARAMTKEEYNTKYGSKAENSKGNGWSRNFKGFIQYRQILEEGIIKS